MGELIVTAIILFGGILICVKTGDLDRKGAVIFSIISLFALANMAAFRITTGRSAILYILQKF